MPVYTETKTYHTKAHMGMIDVTDDFRAAVQNACRKTGMKSGTITGFTTFRPTAMSRETSFTITTMTHGTMTTVRRISRRRCSARLSLSRS